jgi:release factor glutamine methyltransferase
MSQSNAWTVGRLLTWTTDYLKQHGATSPRLDAEVLLAAARGCERIQLYTSFDDDVDEDVRASFRDFVRRRAAGEPVAYLVGHREFFSLSFDVTPDVLIPRPETEHLVVEALDLIRAYPSTHRTLSVADVGTGSGAIAVSIAKHTADCHITAVDICEKALAVARGNAQRHEVLDRMEFLASDLLSGLPAEPQFELIVSNPPYVSQSEMETLADDVKRFEPRLALLGGENGTELIARLIPQAAERLRDGGWLLIEFSPMIEDATHRLLANDGRFREIQTIKDLAGLPRVVRSQRIAR